MDSKNTIHYKEELIHWGKWLLINFGEKIGKKKNIKIIQVDRL